MCSWIPRVSVRDGGAVGDARDLIAVVPPRHHARVLGGVVAQPPVRLDVVLDDDRAAVLELALEHHRGLRHAPRHVVRIAGRTAANAMTPEAATPAPRRHGPDDAFAREFHIFSSSLTDAVFTKAAVSLRRRRGASDPPRPPVRLASPLAGVLAPASSHRRANRRLRVLEVPRTIRCWPGCSTTCPTARRSGTTGDGSEEDDQAHHAVREIVRHDGVEREEQRRGRGR